MIKIKRRQLLVGMSAVGTGIALSSRVSHASNKRPLKILLLGRTGFIGPHIIRRALDRGHELALFNHGRSNIDLFPAVEKFRAEQGVDGREMSR